MIIYVGCITLCNERVLFGLNIGPDTASCIISSQVRHQRGLVQTRDQSFTSLGRSFVLSQDRVLRQRAIV